MTTQEPYAAEPTVDSTPASTSGATTSNTSLLADVAEPDATTPERRNRWHGGLDFGLLLVRLVLGGTLAAHGLQKLFGTFDGPGIDGFARALGSMGYTSGTTFLAWATGIAELGGGALVILGLFTPLGAAAILGVAANIVYAKYSGGFFIGMQPGKGFEYELMFGVIALALLFTGPGRIAIDVNTPWRRKPVPYALLGILLAAAASVLVIVLFR